MLNAKLFAAARDLEAAVVHYNALPEQVIERAAALHAIRSERGPRTMEAVTSWASSLVNPPPALQTVLGELKSALGRLADTGERPLLLRAEVLLEKDERQPHRQLQVHVRAEALRPTDAHGIATTFGPDPDHPVTLALQRVVETNRKLAQVYDQYAVMTVAMVMIGLSRRRNDAPEIEMLAAALAIGAFIWVIRSRKKKTRMALEQTDFVRDMARTLEEARDSIERVQRDTIYRLDAVESQLAVLRQYAPTDCATFTASDQKILQVLIDNLENLRRLIDERIGAEGTPTADTRAAA